MAYSNLNDYYASLGKALPSVQERATIFQSSGLGSASQYVGSAAQNAALLGKLTAPKAPVAPKPVVAPVAQPGTDRASLAKSGYQYLGTIAGRDAAIAQYGADRVKNIAGSYYVVPPGLKTPSPTSPIPADKMTNPFGDLSQFLGTNVKPGTVSSDIAGLLALYGKDTAESKKVDELNTQLTDLMGQRGNQATDLQTEMDRQGVNENIAHIKELTLKTAQLKGELDQFDAETEAQKSAIDDQAIPTGLITGEKAQLQKQRDLTRLGKAAELSATTALTQAYQGNANLGMELAQKAVDMKYAPILNQIDVLKTQIGIASDKMSAADSARSKVIGYLLDENQNRITEQKKKDADVMSIAVDAAAAGAPLAVVNSIRASGDPAKAASLASPYLNKKKNTTTTTEVPTDPTKMTDKQLKTDYNLSLNGLKDNVQVKAGGPGRFTREQAAQQIFDHYGGRVSKQTILNDIYKQYPDNFYG